MAETLTLQKDKDFYFLESADQYRIKQYKIRASIGACGLVLPSQKREGDGKTPIGDFNIKAGFYRPDRLNGDDLSNLKQNSGLCLLPLDKMDGWCDDPEEAHYNCHIRLPFKGGHEKLWRDDGLYDLFFILDYNLIHPIPYAGSAIFLHCAKPDYSPTKGCIALNKKDLISLFSSPSYPSKIIIPAS